MATIKRNLVFAAAFAAVAAPIAVRFYKKWILERETKAWLGEFGNHPADVEDCLADKASEGSEQPSKRPRGWSRQSKGATGKLALVAADEAYLQFGRRERSQANDLVTRKFLRDWLRERPGLRAKDLSAIIEVALSLSYVPPKEYVVVSGYEQTRAYRSVVGSNPPRHF